MHTIEQQEYIAKHKLKVVQLAGDDTLYQSQWGCRTIEDILLMQQCQIRYFTKLAEERARPKRQPIKVSDELMMRHLRCVDEHGCGLFEGEGY